MMRNSAFSDEQATRAARQLWEAAFDYTTPWPEGLHVRWNKRMTRMWGYTAITWFMRKRVNVRTGRSKVLERTNPRPQSIDLSYKLFISEAGQYHGKRFTVFETLLHEFVHVRHPYMKHGAMFDARVDSLKRRLGI